MNTRQHDNRSLSPTTAGWWVRLVVAGVFAFYLNYVPIHLASATHLDGVLESLAELVFHSDDHHAEHQDSDGHVPHPASDHTLTLTAQTQSPVSATAVVCVLSDTSILHELPQQQQQPIPVFERIRPPGESPPDPLQPRAPPLA